MRLTNEWEIDWLHLLFGMLLMEHNFRGLSLIGSYLCISAGWSRQGWACWISQVTETETDRRRSRNRRPGIDDAAPFTLILRAAASCDAGDTPASDPRHRISTPRIQLPKINQHDAVFTHLGQRCRQNPESWTRENCGDNLPIQRLRQKI